MSSNARSPESFQRRPDPSEVIEAKAEQRAIREECLKKRIMLFARCEVEPEFRAAVLNQLTGTPADGEDAIEAAIRGCLFYFYYFAWTYDPRALPKEQYQPMVLYPYQVKIIRWIITNIESVIDSIDRFDGLFEKSRDMGLSWIIYQVAIWYMIFRRGNVLIGCNTVGDLDKLGDLSTPFEKLRSQIRQLHQLTPWVLPDTFDIDKDMPEAMIRMGEGRQIVGKPSTASFGRGPRVTFVIMDEYQSWEMAYPAFTSSTETSNCRFIIGTPLGPHNHYARLARGEADEKVYVYRVHWSDHPIKGRGLKRDERGQLWSPWYAWKTEKMAPEQVASELDIKYDTSTKARVFTGFSQDVHTRKQLETLRGTKILRVWDPGKTFAVLFLQIDKWHRIRVLREEIFDNAELHHVAQEIQQISQEYYGDHEFEDCGDPAGASRVSSAQEAPEYTILAEYDIHVDYFYIQEMQPRLRVKARIQSIQNKLRELVSVNDKAEPALLIDATRCPKLIEALSEKYRWKQDKVSKKILDVIDEQHPFEDVVDCLGYGLLYKFGVSGTGGYHSQEKVTVEKGSVSWKRSGVMRRSR